MEGRGNDFVAYEEESTKVYTKRLTVRQLKAIEMLVDPEGPATKSAVASQVGVSRTTLYKWLKDPAFIEELNRQADAVLRAFRYRVDRALMRKIEEGDIQAIKLYYERLNALEGVNSPAIVVTIEGV